MKVKFKLGQEVWALGLCVQKGGTPKPNVYYLPMKAIINKVQMVQNIHGIQGVEYGIRPKYKKANSTLNHQYYLAEENDIFSSKKKCLNIARQRNASARNFKRLN